MDIRCLARTIRLRAAMAASRFRKETGGVAAVEFAFIAPIMILLFVGTIELSAGISTNRKLSRVSSTIGDLITQSQTLTQNDIVNIMDVSAKIMYPYSQDLDIEVNLIDIAGGQATAVQRCTNASGCVNVNEVYNVPAKIKKDGTFLVAAEISATYTPSFGWAHYEKGRGIYFSRTPIAMREELFLRPRIGSKVEIK